MLLLCRTQTVVSWLYQRWVWHVETVMSENSHVMFYDDMKVNENGLLCIQMRSIYALCSHDVFCGEHVRKRLWSHRRGLVVLGRPLARADSFNHGEHIDVSSSHLQQQRRVRYP